MTDKSPPWILHCVDGRPDAILPAGRPGEVMRVTGFTMERAKAIVDGANAAFREAELKRLEESVESVRRAVDAFLKPDAFTVGSKGSYDKAIEGWAQKTGFRPPGDKDIPEGYEGGWVWRSKIAAWAWLCGVDPVQEDGPVPDHRRLGDSMISFEGRPPVLCDVYGLVLPNGWDEDVSKEPMQGGLYGFDPFGPYALLNDALIVPA